MSSLVVPKTTVRDLAVFTQKPAFDNPLFVGSPGSGGAEEFRARAGEIFERGWYTNDGPVVRAFEARVADELDVAECVALANGTLALDLMLRAAGIRGEVIIPSFTFVATAHALRWQGLEPVFCDIDRRTHNLDPDQAERLITQRTGAILAVHLWGRPAYDARLEALALRHDLPLFYDASHAFGCSYEGCPIGGRGAAETLSFHATKILSTFEGGAVVTNDESLAERVRLLRNFGFVDYDDVRALGTNAKLNELSGAMGHVSLDRVAEAITHNRKNYDAYRSYLKDVPGVTLLAYDAGERQNYQYVVIELDEGASALSRDDLVRVLHAENVIARRYFFPGCHRMEPYRTEAPDVRLPETDAVAGRVVVVPTGPTVGDEAVRTICGLIRIAVEHAAELPRELPPFWHGDGSGEGA